MMMKVPNEDVDHQDYLGKEGRTCSGVSMLTHRYLSHQLTSHPTRPMLNFRWDNDNYFWTMSKVCEALDCSPG